MLPMLVAVAIGQMTYVVALGQGGFFFSSLLLPRRISGRLIMGSILIALGMGFYLMGGTVAPLPVVAVIFTFFAVLNGLCKKAKVGQMPLFYTATILILYSLNHIESGKDLAMLRLAYNLVGIAVAAFVVFYPFPMQA